MKWMLDPVSPVLPITSLTLVCGLCSPSYQMACSSYQRVNSWVGWSLFIPRASLVAGRWRGGLSASDLIQAPTWCSSITTIAVRTCSRRHDRSSLQCRAPSRRHLPCYAAALNLSFSHHSTLDHKARSPPLTCVPLTWPTTHTITALWINFLADSFRKSSLSKSLWRPSTPHLNDTRWNRVAPSDIIFQIRRPVGWP